MATILVVDDEPVILDLIEEALTAEGHAVERASNGAECLDMMNGHIPDLILSDIMMPVVNGPELCRRLSAHPRYHRIPVVKMSAIGEKSKIEGCVYTSFLEKPFMLDELYATIDAALGQHEMERGS